MDADSVYWTNMTIDDSDGDVPGMVMRVGKLGGDVTKLADAATQPVRLTLDDDSVYWATTGGQIGRVPKAGGEAELILDGDKQLWDISTDGTYVYASATNYGTVRRVAILAPHDVTAVKGADSPLSITTRSNVTYWTGAHGVMKLIEGEDSAAPVYQTDNQEGWLRFVGIAADDSRVYFTSYLSKPKCGGDGLVLSIAHDGGEPVTIASDTETDGSRMAVDDVFVYWTEVEQGRVMRAPKKGGDAEVIACDQKTPLGIAVDDEFVYWANRGAGTIVKAHK